jgi:hypothetical protein
MRLPVACGAVLFAATIAATPAPSHFVSRVTSDEAIRPAEASIAINPANTDHLVAVSLQAMPPGFPSRISNFSYTSTDGGRTWETAAAPNTGRVHGDDAVTIARDGVIYHSYIAFDGIRVPRPDRASSGIFVRTSRDGVTWNEPVPVVDHLNTAIPLEDKPWLSVDDADDSPHRGNVYVVWTRFDVYGSPAPEHKTHIWFARSRDGARSFSPPVRISDAPGDAKDSDGTVEGVVPAVGLKGEVYVAWAGPSGIAFDKSIDGGYTFGADTIVTEMPGGWDIPQPGMTRHNGMPVTGVDHSRGPHRGSIYINWIDQRNGDTDVFLASSRDGGVTWAVPVRVNDDTQGNGRPQLFTWMAVDPSDGSINIVFLDRRDTQGTHNAVTLARSTDGAKTFTNMRIDRPPFPSDDRVFYGDYLGVDAHGGRVAVIYPVVVETSNRLVLESAVFHFR